MIRIRRLYDQDQEVIQIALQGTTQESLPQVKFGQKINLRLFGVCFLTKIKVDPDSW